MFLLVLFHIVNQATLGYRRVLKGPYGITKDTYHHTKASHQPFTSKRNIKALHQHVIIKHHTNPSHLSVTLKRHNKASYQSITSTCHNKASHQHVIIKRHTKPSHLSVTSKRHAKASHQRVTLKRHIALILINVTFNCFLAFKLLVIAKGVATKNLTKNGHEKVVTTYLFKSDMIAFFSQYS